MDILNNLGDFQKWRIAQGIPDNYSPSDTFPKNVEMERNRQAELLNEVLGLLSNPDISYLLQNNKYYCQLGQVKEKLSGMVEQELKHVKRRLNQVAKNNSQALLTKLMKFIIEY